jgi:alanyl-tRNA synthetase
MTEELAREKGKKIDKEDFWKKFKKHQKLSRTATVGKFKSGLADYSKEVTKLHTATHLLLAALRQVLGNHVYQKGSNITAERLRLDFSYPEKMTSIQIKKVEDLVNKQIKKDLPVVCEEMSLEQAKKSGAIGVFETRYGERVKVYSIGNPAGAGPPFSREICSGPHVKSTGELGHFKVIKEESSSAGVRRIKAILE